MRTKSHISTLIALLFVLSNLLTPLSSHALSSISIRVGEKIPLKALMELPNLNNQEAEGLKPKWITTDEKIAKVDYSNNLVGIGKGTATVSVTLDGKTILASLKVTVTSTVQGVDVEKTSLTLQSGQEYVMKAYVKPYNAFDQKVKWTSSDRTIASVSMNGLIKGVKSGTATITVETEDGGYKATCKVTVKSSATSIQIPQKTLVLKVGEKKNIGAKLVPDSGFTQTFKYTLSNKDIASIDTKGNVTPKKEGSTNVTLTTADGKYPTVMTIQVVSNVDTLYVVKKDGTRLTSLTVKVGETSSLIPVSDLKNIESLAGYKVEWQTSNQNVATIDSRGVVKGLSNGTATITFTVPQELKPIKATMTVTVVSTVTGVKLNKTSTQISVGGTETLQAFVSPTNAYLKDVTWKSSDTKIATVSNGVVKGVTAGTATITATTVDGKKVANCTVKVVSLAKGINAPSTIKVTMGVPVTFKATVTPNTVLVKTLSYKLTTKDGASIVKVSKGKQDGEFILTGLKQGKTQLELTSKDGNLKKVISIEVVPTKINVTIIPKH